MTCRHDADERVASTSHWLLMLTIPIVLAAGVLEQSGNHLVLPEEDSYRSNFTDTIFESSEWRKPPAPELPWREPPRPEIGWRTPPNSTSSPTTSRRRIELFPRYQPGRTTDFDPITREEKPLIKLFEFGS